MRQTRTDVDNTGFSILDIDDISRRATSLDALVEYHNMYFILLGGREPERVAAGVVSLGLLPGARRHARSSAAPSGPETTATTPRRRSS